jgi:integrase
MYHRGLRASEIGLLQLSDFKEKEGILYVRRVKNSLSQDYELLPAEMSAMRAWMKIRGHAPGPLFPSQKGPRAGGLGIHRNRLFELFRGYCKKAGLRDEKAHLHVWKHSAGTHLSERGETSQDIQDWLGHRAASSTSVYTHYTARRRAEAFRRQRDWT